MERIKQKIDIEKKKTIEILQDRSGNASLYTIFIVFLILIFLLIAIEYGRVMIIGSRVRDTLQSSTISVATNNWDESFGGIKKIEASSYELNESDIWIDSSFKGYLVSEVCEELGLIQIGGKYVSYTPNGATKYYLENIDIEIKNGFGDSLKIVTSCKLVMPNTYSDKYPIEVDVKSSSGYRELF